MTAVLLDAEVADEDLKEILRALGRRAHSPVAESDWTIGPSEKNSNHTLYRISAKDKCDEVCRERNEFNFACGQFSNMLRLKKGFAHVEAVDIVVYKEQASVLQRFRARKQLLVALAREVWVFHGTTEIAAIKILKEGFKIGGDDAQVPIKNGAACGRGVYAATGPSDPMRYAGQADCVVLAKAVPGLCRDIIQPDEEVDSWKPCKDWIVFRHCDQLLPVYVIHYTASPLNHHY